MIRASYLAIALLSLAAVAGAPGVRAAADEPYKLYEKPRYWYTFLKPEKTTPVEQLKYARQMRDEGRLRRACRQYKALSASWPSAPEAATAYLERAETLEKRGRPEEAFEVYQELMDKFSDSAPFEQVIERQFKIAEQVMLTKRARFLFGGFAAPERAVPLFESIVKTAPFWKRVPEAQLNIGRAHELNGDYAEAAAAFLVAEYRYAGTPAADEAALRRAVCLYHEALESPNHYAVADEAWQALSLYLRSHPDSPRKEELDLYRKVIYTRRAAVAYEKAQFYDRNAKTTSGAIKAYEMFLMQFPESDLAATARAREKELRLKMERTHEKPAS